MHRLMLHAAVVTCALCSFDTARAASPLSSALTATNAVSSIRAEGEAPPVAVASGPALTDAQVQGYGCLVSGSVATALTWLAGTNQMIMVIAGGTMGPTNPLGTAVAITGTVFASVCAVGALATPAVLHAWDALTASGVDPAASAR